MLDVNKDGYIPATELRHILMREGTQPLSEQEPLREGGSLKNLNLH